MSEDDEVLLDAYILEAERALELDDDINQDVDAPVTLCYICIGSVVFDQQISPVALDSH